MTPGDQIHELLKKSQKILLVTRKIPSEDSLASLLAFSFVLEKMLKEVDALTSGPILPTLSFLPKSSSLKNDLEASRTFVISLDTSEVKISQLSYDSDKDGNRLNIYIVPSGGVFRADQIKTKTENFGYDAIVVLDSPDLEMLGPVYKKNSSLFYETPIINIDYRPQNTRYGEINLIDRSATSCAEILFSLFERINPQLIDENIATSLLVGMVAATKSFQVSNVSAKAFNIAAALVARGADQQKIIRHIFKNKSLSTLKLWGRALARVQFDGEARLAWTKISNEDFQKTNAAFENLFGIEEELNSSLAGVETILILSENKEKQIQGLVKTKEDLTPLFVQKFNAKMQNGLLQFNAKETDLLTAEKEVVSKIREMKRTK